MTGRIHGTRTSYRNGCRCDLCATAESDVQYAYRYRQPTPAPRPPYVTREDWLADAACRGSDTPQIWFPNKGDSIAAAVAICRDCPVRVDCLEYALRHCENHGIYGGVSPRARRDMRRGRRAS